LSGVTEFVVGDMVFGDVKGLRTGTVAEYVVVDESITCLKPSNLSHAQAAGAPLAGMTALQCFSACRMPQGGSVLITAGAGGVGSYAIQIARALYEASLIVTTASAGAKADLVTALGAHRAVNYRAQDIVNVSQDEGWEFDCVIDCTGEAAHLAPLVKHGGGLVSILACPTGEMLNKWMEVSVGPGVTVASVISGSVRVLGSGVDLFTGAGSISSALQKRGGATYKFVITTPDKGA
jgi:NADPH:quinone reductase-like Zn-dependent oxidoreductase